MFLTEIGKCDFLTKMYYYKNNKSRSLCQANTNKKESQISLELFCGAYGTRNRLAALLAKNPDPGSRGEYIQKKEETLRFLLAVRTGLEPVTPCVTGRYSNQLN